MQDLDDHGDDFPEAPLPQEPPLLHSIKEYLKLNFEPTQDYPAAIRVTTRELFERIQELYPTDSITPATLAEYLHELGFKYHNEGEFRFVWLIKEV